MCDAISKRRLQNFCSGTRMSAQGDEVVEHESVTLS